MHKTWPVDLKIIRTKLENIHIPIDIPIKKALYILNKTIALHAVTQSSEQ